MEDIYKKYTDLLEEHSKLQQKCIRLFNEREELMKHHIELQKEFLRHLKENAEDGED